MLCKFRARTARLVAFATEYGTSYFRLKWYLIVLAAVVADDLETPWSVSTNRSLFTAAFRAPLRRHHVALIEGFLLFFGEKKGVFTLNTRCFNVRHSSFLLSDVADK